MIAEEYLGRSRLFRRLKSGPHRQLVELYTARLVRDELAGHGTWRCLNLVDDLFSWIKRCELKLTDLDERVAERYLKYRAGKQCIQPGDRAALKRLLSVLREAGMIAPAPLPPITPEDQIFEGFSDYLRRERGLAPRSIIRHLPFVRRFLREVCPAGAISARSAKRTSPATSSATPGIGARDPGRRCAGRYGHFSDTSIIKG
jgi:hypothetical protein